MPIGIFKNNTNLLRSSLWLLVLRFFGLFQSLLTIKIYFGFLDHTLFAFLIVLFSYQIVFSFFDLGIGNAIINRGVNYIVQKKLRNLSSLFLGSLFFLLIWAMLLSLILTLLIKFSFLSRYIFPGISNREFVGNMFLLCSGLSTFRCALCVVNSFRLVFNETFYNGIFDSAALLLSIISQILAVHFKLDFVWHVVIIFGVPILGHLANLSLLVRQRPYLVRSSYITVITFFRQEIKPVFRDGAKFFMLQLVSTFAYNSVPIVLSIFSKTNEIAIYGILARIFNPVSSLITVFLQPQWSYLSASYLNKEYRDIQKTYLSSLFFVLFTCVLYLVTLFVLRDPIRMYLIKDNTHFPVSIVVIFSVYIILANISGVFATILNAVNAITYQVKFAIIVMVLFVIEVILFVPAYGLVAVLLFLCLNIMATSIIPSYIKTKTLLNQ